MTGVAHIDWAYATEKVYTRRDVDQLLAQQAERLGTINRVVQKGREFDVALQIVAVHRLPDGVLVEVR